MASLPNVYNPNVTDDYKRYFETALGYWLSNGGKPDEFVFYKYSSYMGGSLDKSAHDPSSIESMAQGVFRQLQKTLLIRKTLDDNYFFC